MSLWLICLFRGIVGRPPRRLRRERLQRIRNLSPRLHRRCLLRSRKGGLSPRMNSWTPCRNGFRLIPGTGPRRFLADALGGAKDGANTWQTDDRKTILRVRENAANILAVIPKSEQDQVARACQFETTEKLAEWGETLPSVAE